jgi:type III restriction enzyme
MKVTLFDFQEDALAQLHTKLAQARSFAAIDNPQAISFAAPTGAGKTIVMTALFEDILFGAAGYAAQPDAVILWLSDMPELNEQTRLKIESKSSRIRVNQLVTIDAAFDAERLSGGHIYFINTQKLGTDKLLTRQGDKRQYPIWETLTNTAKAIPDRFLVVIDEAHRGMRTGKVAQTAHSIMQRFLLGSAEHGLCPMPLVLGVSATPRRFEDLLAGTNHTVHKVHVPAEDVRQSGLLKDRILIHYPDSSSQAEMTLLAEAATRWRAMRRDWQAYCQTEGLPPVQPILVVQVADGTDKILTKTDLATAVATIESVTGEPLAANEIAHAFTESKEIDVAGRKIRHLEASRIEDDPHVRVVFFKMSLSTGWDCPRAEVMMSFRRAHDHTYIAQLLGRMVRTPLARQVEKDAALNDVHLFLPHYDETAVHAVIHDLQNVEDVPPAQVGVSREMVTLHKRPGSEAIFAAMQQLITYRVNAARQQSGLRRLMGLGRALTHDQLDPDAQTRVTNQIVAQMSAAITALRSNGDYDARVKQITGVDLETIALHGTIVADDKASYTIQAATADIDRLFDRAGLLLSNGLHIAYWKQQTNREHDEVKIEVIALTQDSGAMARLEAFTVQAFDTLYEDYKWRIGQQTEQRRQHYGKLRLSTAKPQSIQWHLPDSISFRRRPDAPLFDKHLYVDEANAFRAELGSWEAGVLTEELADPAVIGWLRNVDRQPWSLEIPYKDGGAIKPMFPDMVIIRQDGDALRFDILEPHDPSLRDNVAKAVGLAEFVENHPFLFDRVQLIRKQKGADGQEHFFDEQPLARLFVGQHLVVEVSGGDDAVHVPDFQRRQRLQRDADAGRVEMLPPGGQPAHPPLPRFGQGVGRVNELGAEGERLPLHRQRRQAVGRFGGDGQRRQRRLVQRRLRQPLHRLARGDLRPLALHAKQDDLLEALVGFVGEAVDLHPVEPGEDIARRFAEAQ